MATLTPLDGQQVTIQNLVNLSTTHDGDTIIIPTGTWQWSGLLTVTKAINFQGQTQWTWTPGTGTAANPRGAGTLNAGVGVIINNNASTRMMSLTSNNVASITFQELAFTGNTSGTEAVLTGGTGLPIIFKNCFFVNQYGGSLARLFDWQSLGGIFSNCVIWANSKQQLVNDAGNNALSFCRVIGKHSWSTSPTYGMNDTNGLINLYFEDCEFYNITSQCIDSDDDARVVIRHCLIYDTGNTSHGADSSQRGNRHLEIYSNTFVHTSGANGGNSLDSNGYPQNLSWWYNLRGGTMLVSNNAIPDNTSGWWGSNKPSVEAGDWAVQRGLSGNFSNSCPTSYPSPYQPGWGSNGSTVTNCATTAGNFAVTQNVEPIYVWSNTVGSRANLLDFNDWGTDSCHLGFTTANFVVQGREYFLGGTGLAGYTTFTYPHPLVSSGAIIPRNATLRIG